MESLDENSMWIMLYKNRLSFIDKSVDEFTRDIEAESLLKGIGDNPNRSKKSNKVDIGKRIVKKFRGQVIQIEKVLEEELECLHNNLDVNENKFINELSIQDELSEEIKILKYEKEKFEILFNSEKVNISTGFEKIFNHLNNTMDRIEEKGIKNILDRKGAKVVELLECFKKNLYKYFIKSIIIFENINCESNIEIIIGNKISKELNELKSHITEYLFKEYINEFEWSEIIEEGKKKAVECIYICEIYVLEASLIVKKELENKIKKSDELLKDSFNRVEEIKYKRSSMEKNLFVLNNKYEELVLSNEDEISELRLFKGIIRSNYIKEYNRIVKLINNKNTLNKDIKTYYEYLYLITSEMEKVEGDLYG